MEAVLILIYIVLSYMAINKLWWSKRVYITRNWGRFYGYRIGVSMFLGVVAIPIAAIVLICEALGKKN